MSPPWLLFVDIQQLDMTPLIGVAKYAASLRYMVAVYGHENLSELLASHHIPHQYHSVFGEAAHTDIISALTSSEAPCFIIANLDNCKLINRHNITKIGFLRSLISLHNVPTVLHGGEICLQQFQMGTASRNDATLVILEKCNEFDSMLIQHIKAGNSLSNGQSVIVIGSGGREHALVKALCRSRQVEKIFVAPGNAGTEEEITSWNVKVRNVALPLRSGFAELVVFAKEVAATMVIVGPEQPLAEGISDVLVAHGIPCFGPSREASKIEASKAWSKDFMKRNNIPTSDYVTITNLSDAEKYLNTIDHRVVVKASGLAAGKGVLMPESKEEALSAVEYILGGSFGDQQVVIEDYLHGFEVSVLAVCDGTVAVGLPPAQDHKRIGEGDTGLNTGGMGAYAPTPLLTKAQYSECMRIIQNTVDAMKAEGTPFIGVLFAGFMIDPVRGPMVLEFNCRFGDPETQVIMPLINSDVFELFYDAVQGRLNTSSVSVSSQSACTVVCASAGYPTNYTKGHMISGLDKISHDVNLQVIHAGTKYNQDDHLVTNGGRVLCVTGIGEDLQSAIRFAYSGIEKINFDGMLYRRDIGVKGLDRKIRIGVLGSTRGTSLQPLLDAIDQEELKAEVVIAISNKKSAYILERCARHNVPTVFLSSLDKSREEYDQLLCNTFDEAGVDLVLMVGYMRIVSKVFTDHFTDRCLNVHPSLLPKFAGGMDLNVHQEVIDAKEKTTGCTIHFVTEEVDGGPILLQESCNVYEDDTAESLKARVQELEGRAFIKAVNMMRNSLLCHKKTTLSYRSAGVNIVEADELIGKIKPLCKSTQRPGSEVDLGGFGGLFDLAKAGYSPEDTVLVSGTDGVGTKLKIAQEMAIHDTIGIDLVAMCVNDILVCGAEPLFFLDYFACGKLDKDVAFKIISGIAEGCRQANCALIGGETAEMPGMYDADEYDLAGFSVGAVQRSSVLPTSLKSGDILIGLESSGVHSNGFSLVRKCVEHSGRSFFDEAPFQQGTSIGKALMTPTKIYVRDLIPLVRRGLIKAMAHITGGGLYENIPRILPDHLAATIQISTSDWVLPPVFKWLKEVGNIQQRELLRTFNCGIGMVLVVEQSDAYEVMSHFNVSDTKPYLLGQLTDRQSEAVHIIGRL